MTEPEAVHPDLAPLLGLLDERVVGHDDAKRALLLGLVCREHIYLEGPPGTAKTLMAEVAARGSDLDFFFYQFHRDTRLAELVGDVAVPPPPPVPLVPPFEISCSPPSPPVPVLP